jgi:hypothetical protein
MSSLATASDADFLALAQKQVPEGSWVSLFPSIVAWWDKKNKLDNFPGCTTISTALRSLRRDTVFVVEGRLDKVWEQGSESNWHCILVLYHDRPEGQRAITIYDPKPESPHPTYVGTLKPKLVRGVVETFLKAAPANTKVFWHNGDHGEERPHMACRLFCMEALQQLVAHKQFGGDSRLLPSSRPKS